MELEIRSLPNPGGSGNIGWYGVKGWAYVGGSTFHAWVTDVDTGHRLPSTNPPSVGASQSQPPAGATGAGFSRGTPAPTLPIIMADLQFDARTDELSKAGIDPHFMNFL